MRRLAASPFTVTGAAAPAIGEPEIDVVRGSLRNMVGDDVARDGAQVHARQRTIDHARLLAREGQQLLDEVRGAIEPGAQLGQRRSALGSRSPRARRAAPAGAPP